MQLDSTLFLKAKKVMGTSCEASTLLPQPAGEQDTGLPVCFLGVTQSRVCSVLHYAAVFVHLLSFTPASEPDLLAPRSNSDVETCEEEAKIKS